MKGASTRVFTTVNAPRDWFFYWFLSVDLTRIMHKYMFLPSVIAIRDQTGPMHQAGSSRVIQFSDGSTAIEEIRSCDPPGIVRYGVSQLTSVFRHLIREGYAQITFSQSPEGGTLVEWQYTFYGHSWAATLILRPMVSVFWKGFLRSALSRAKQLAEVEPHGHPE